jgi:hypothetical protein
MDFSRPANMRTNKYAGVANAWDLPHFQNKTDTDNKYADVALAIQSPALPKQEWICMLMLP